jgi:hypothetical protein
MSGGINWKINKKDFYAGMAISILLVITLLIIKYSRNQEPFALPVIPGVCETKDKAPQRTISPVPTRNPATQELKPVPVRTQPPIQPPKSKKTISCAGGLNLAPPPENIQTIIRDYTITNIPPSLISQVTNMLRINIVTGPLVKEISDSELDKLSGLLLLQNGVAFSQIVDMNMSETQRDILGTHISAMINDSNPIISQFANNYFSGTDKTNSLGAILTGVEIEPPKLSEENIKAITDIPVLPASDTYNTKNKEYIMVQINKGNIYLDIEKCINFLTAGLKFS